MRLRDKLLTGAGVGLAAGLGVGAPLAGATKGPFGVPSPMTPRTLYLTTPGTMGLLGLLALLAVLGVTLAQSRRAYRALRANDAETGIALAAGACALVLFLGGLMSNPLASAPVAVLFWLLLGHANATFARLARADEARDDAHHGLRGAPLRIVFAAAGGDTRDTAPELLDAFRALDRRQVTPLLLSYGEGPLARVAPDADALTRVVLSHDPAALSLAATLPERWLAALWAGVGQWNEPDSLACEPEREDLAAVAASVAVAPAGGQAWASIGA